MEKGRNSYYGLAVSHYNQALSTVSYAKEYDDYNSVASLCAQSCEKLFKAYLEINYFGSDLSLMKTHNLRRLAVEVKNIDSTFNLSIKDYKWVGDFYFDARYPGNDFVVVSEADSEECLRLTKELKDWIDSSDFAKEESELEGLKEL